jgi:hypothetical protein
VPPCRRTLRSPTSMSTAVAGTTPASTSFRPTGSHTNTRDVTPEEVDGRPVDAPRTAPDVRDGCEPRQVSSRRPEDAVRHGSVELRQASWQRHRKPRPSTLNAIPPAGTVRARRVGPKWAHCSLRPGGALELVRRCAAPIHASRERELARLGSSNIRAGRMRRCDGCCQRAPPVLPLLVQPGARPSRGRAGASSERNRGWSCRRARRCGTRWSPVRASS